MTFYEIIEDACKKRNISVSALLEKSKVSKGNITRWKEGDNPSISTVKKIAPVLNMDISELISTHNSTISPNEKSLLNHYRTLSPNGKQFILNSIKNLASIEASKELTPRPYHIKYAIDKVSAGKGYDLNNNDLWKKRKIIYTEEVEEADFAVSVEGDSMLPDYEDGDVVLVKSQKHIEIGQIGIFTIGDEGYIKQYGEDCLISLNPKRGNILPSAYYEMICWGLVIGKATLLDD